MLTRFGKAQYRRETRFPALKDFAPLITSVGANAVRNNALSELATSSGPSDIAARLQARAQVRGSWRHRILAHPHQRRRTRRPTSRRLHKSAHPHRNGLFLAQGEPNPMSDRSPPVEIPLRASLHRLPALARYVQREGGQPRCLQSETSLLHQSPQPD